MSYGEGKKKDVHPDDTKAAVRLATRLHDVVMGLRKRHGNPARSKAEKKFDRFLMDRTEAQRTRARRLVVDTKIRPDEVGIRLAVMEHGRTGMSATRIRQALHKVQ